ncbi:MAG: hypothetical protein MZV49_12760 [Rhodopseudomonas palustris]|nr:hypothetical protein [Rhodopseudomonas palustris]
MQAQVIGLSHERPGRGAGRPQRPQARVARSSARSTSPPASVGSSSATTRRSRGYLAGLDLKPRVALRTLPEGGEILRAARTTSWERILAYGQADSLTTQPLEIEGDGKSALLLSSVGRDTVSADAA